MDYQQKQVIALAGANTPGDVTLRIVKGLDQLPQLEVRIPDRRPVRAELTPQMCDRLIDDLLDAREELVEIDANATFGTSEPTTDDPLGNVSGEASGIAQDESDSGDEQPVVEIPAEQPSELGAASEGAAAPQTEQPQAV
jgi:hypothetical protein